MAAFEEVCRDIAELIYGGQSSDNTASVFKHIQPRHHWCPMHFLNVVERTYHRKRNSLTDRPTCAPGIDVFAEKSLELVSHICHNIADRCGLLLIDYSTPDGDLLSNNRSHYSMASAPVATIEKAHVQE